MNDYLNTTVHKLKTHMSRYLRVLEAGQAKAVVVYRGKQRVAMLLAINPAKSEDNTDQHLQAPRGS